MRSYLLLHQMLGADELARGHGAHWDRLEAVEALRHACWEVAVLGVGGSF
jgi:hypothetical protein